eukprot:TRINITY_DN76395_c0_g1_i1.p1 TRINITY_DN76395_c0_g1~~TRINITY_DN76395_c0_g1_i1.p1  ORF type:complete len:296 (+),score=61.84 TRINITY_DN76395_c0_g1_i1:39-926(+)
MANPLAILGCVWLLSVLSHTALGDGSDDYLHSEGSYSDMPHEDDIGSEAEGALSEDVLHLLHMHMDADKDGNLTYQEAVTFVDATNPEIEKKEMRHILASIDSSMDGKVSLTEYLDDIRKAHSEHGDGSDEVLRDILEVSSAHFIVSDADKNDHLDEQELKGLYFADSTSDGVPNIALQQAFSRKDVDEDGKLTLNEFWDGRGANEDLLDREVADFAALDTSKDDFLDVHEFRVWEMGLFHVREAMASLFEIADKNNDMHVTKQELSNAREALADSSAQFHLLQLAVHHNEHNEL